MNLAELGVVRTDSLNPCRHVKRFKEENRQRFLSDEKHQRLRTALREIVQERSQTASAIAATLCSGRVNRPSR